MHRELDGGENESIPFGQWLIFKRKARGMRPTDLVKAAAGIGEKLSTGQITNWERHGKPASAESARLLARLLNADPVEALRAAGRHDWADFAEAMRAAPPSLDEQSTPGHDAFLESLRASNDPEMAELADMYEQDLRRLRRWAQLEQAEIARKASASEGPGDDAHDAA